MGAGHASAFLEKLFWGSNVLGLCVDLSRDTPAVARVLVG